MALFKHDDENEVSGAQVFGYILIGAAVLFVVSFIVFAIYSKLSGGTEVNQPAKVAVEQTVVVEDGAN